MSYSDSTTSFIRDSGYPLRYFRNDILVVDFAETKRWPANVSQAKILIAENGVFENELNNYLNNEILNDKLCLRFSCIWDGYQARA